MYANFVFWPNKDVTFWGIFRQNPYCLVDPTCMNPWGDLRDGFANRGFAQNEFWSMNNFSGLAWPNYVFFMLLLIAVVVLVVRFVPKRWHMRWIALDVVGAWCVVEINRWFLNINHSVSPHAETVLLGQQYGLIAFSLAVLGGVAYLVNRLRYWWGHRRLPAA